MATEILLGSDEKSVEAEPEKTSSMFGEREAADVSPHLEGFMTAENETKAAESSERSAEPHLKKEQETLQHELNELHEEMEMEM